MKNKSTKYALLSSAMAILLCTVMLMGLTFAWFTDSANTGVSIIRSGSFDLVLLNSEGESIENTSVEWIKEEGQTEAIWRPGCTYQLPDITIVNEGNLDLKYNIIFNGLDGDAELLDVITFTVTVDGEEVDLEDYEGELSADESDVMIIKGHMDENAGIEYQNMTINSLSITVQSTQINGNLEGTTNENVTGNTQPSEPSTNQIIDVYRTLESNDGNALEFSDVNNVEARTFLRVKSADKTPSVSFVNVSGVKADNLIVVDESNTALKIIALNKGSYTINNKLVVNNSESEINLYGTYPIEINGQQITSADGLKAFVSGSVKVF